MELLPPWGQDQQAEVEHGDGAQPDGEQTRVVMRDGAEQVESSPAACVSMRRPASKCTGPGCLTKR